MVWIIGYWFSYGLPRYNLAELSIEFLHFLSRNSAIADILLIILLIGPRRIVPFLPRM